MIIRITAVPDGPAPYEIRKQWIGVEMPAERLPASALEIDFTKTDAYGLDPRLFPGRQEAEAFLNTFVPGASLGNRGGFKVRFNDAIEALRKKSPEAADWFIANWIGKQGHWVGRQGLSFGPNEAEIIQQ